MTVNEDGLINFFQLGRIRVEGKTLTELENLIYKQVVEKGGNTDFNLSITNFRSKYFSVSLGMKTKSIPLRVNINFYRANSRRDNCISNHRCKIFIFRRDEKYILSYNDVTRDILKGVRIFPGDRIFVKSLSYRGEKVLLVGETGAQSAIPINSQLRSSLPDAIFWVPC